MRISIWLLCFIFSFEHLARALDYSELTYQAKQHVEKQGVSASQFLEAMQQERGYLARQQKAAAILNSSVTQGQQDVAMNLFGSSFEQLQTADSARRAVTQMQGVASRAGSGISGFSYVKYDDGKEVWMKNNLPEKILNEIVKDKDNHKTIRNTVNMVYNEKRLLLSYDADVTDSLGNKTTIKWSGAQYTADSLFYADDKTVANKSLTHYFESTKDETTGETTERIFDDAVYEGKNLVSYDEHITDSFSPDKTTLNHYSDISYDSDHNMSSYVKTITETSTLASQSYSRTYTQKFSGCSYDKDKNLTGYTLVATDEWGTTTTAFTGNYDKWGSLISSLKKETLTDGSVTATTFTGEYNSDLRLIRSTELVANSLNSALSYTRKFTAGVDGDNGYTKHGEVTSYLEEIVAADGKTTTNKWYGAQYDGNLRLLSYKEEITDSLNNTAYKTWVAGDNAYNSLGQLGAYTETTRYGELATIKQVTGAVYDYLGQLAAINEVTTITGTDSLGTVTNYTKTTTRHDATYAANGQISGFIEDTTETEKDINGNIIYNLQTNAVNSNAILAGYTEVRTVTGTNYNQVVTTIRTATGYNGAHQITGYTEKIVDSASPQAYTVTTRSGMLYNSLSQLLAYAESVFNSTTPGSGSSQTVSSIYNINYDSLSNIISREMDSTSVDGIKTHLKVSDIVYTGTGRQVSYIQEETQYLSSDVTTKTTRENIKYDKNGQIDSYTQTVTSTTDSLTRTTNWQADSYLTTGQLAAYHESTRTTGSDAAGSSIDYTNTTARSACAYNDAGLLSSYHELSTSSAAPLVTTTKDVTAMAYDNYGRLAEFVEDKLELNVDDPTLLSLHTVTTRYAAQFTAGRLTGYSESVATKSDNGDLNSTTLTVRSNISYDTYERTSSYDDTVTSSAASGVTNYITWKALSFDATGSATSYTQATRTVGSGLDASTTVTRKNIIYNSLQQVVSYIEEAHSSAAADKTVTTTRTATNYNGLGQVGAYKETMVEAYASSGFTTTANICRSAITYNALNQLTGYSEATVSSLTPSLATATTWAASSYDVNGNLSAYTQRDVQTNTDGTIDLDNTTAKENITYNTLGQIATYKQTTTRYLGTSEAAEITVKTVSNIGYDSNNLTVQYIEASDDGYTVTNSTRSAMAYNNCGFLVSYTDTIHTANSDGAVSDLVSNWSVSEFYSNGRAKSYTQTIKGQTLSGTDTLSQDDTVTRTNIIYDSTGFILSYDESTVSLSDTTTLAWVAASYDAYGRVLGYTQTGSSSSSGPFNLTRSGVVYSTINNINRVISYHEAGSNAGNIYNKDWHAGTQDGTGIIYNAKGQLINYYETGFDSAHGTYTLTHSDALYNALSQAVSYTETLINALNGVTTTVRSDTDYDSLGRVLAYSQTKTDPAGQVTATTWHNAVYDSASRLTAYEQIDIIGTETSTTAWQANHNDSYLANGFLNHYSTVKNTLDNTGATISCVTTDWQASGVNSNFQATGYTETVTTKGVATAAADGNYAALTDEQKAAYTSTTSSSEINTTTATVRTNIVYDTKGLVNSYTDTVTQGATTTTNKWSATSYDTNGLLTGYTQAVTITGENLSRNYTLTRSDISYDSSLRPIAYTDTQIEDGISTVTKTTSVTYNNSGAESTWTKTLTRSAQSEAGEFSYTTTVKRLATAYCGNYVTGYDEQTTSDLDAITTTTHVFGITYDTNGNQASYITKTNKNGTGLQTVYYLGTNALSEAELAAIVAADPGIDLSIVFTTKQETFTLDSTTISVSYDLAYNALNQLIADKEYSLDTTSNILTLNVEKNIVYNSRNQRVSYESTATKQGTAETVSYTDSSGAALTAAVLQALLDADSSATIETLLASGAILRATQSSSINSTTSLTRTNMLYNDFGQVTSYDDLQATSGTTAKVHVYGISYDNKNRESGRVTTTYKRNDNQTGSDFVLDSTVTRSNQTYNSLGLVLSYSDSSVSSSLGYTLTKVDDVSLQYDNQGRVCLQLDGSSYSGIGVRTVYQYNGAILTAESLSALMAANSGKTLEELLDSNIIVQSKQAVDSGLMPKTTTLRYGFSYNGLNQATGYSDFTATVGEGGYSVTTTSDIVYSENEELAFSCRNSYALEADNQANSSLTFTFRDYSGATLLSARDISTSTNTDGYFYTALSRTYNDYSIVYNEAQLTQATAYSSYINFSPTSGDTAGESVQATNYGYDALGNLNAMSATSSRSESDEYGNSSTSTGYDVYDIINGEAKLALSTSTTNALNIDSSTSVSNSYTVYSYDNSAKLSSARGVVTTSSNDGFGNLSTSTSIQNYTIILEKAKLIKTTTESDSTNYDGSTSSSNMAIDYSYNADGTLNSALGKGTTLSDDGYGNTQTSSVTQNYFVFANQAVLDSAVNITTAQDKDGTTSQSTTVTQYNYAYDAVETTKLSLDSATAHTDSTSNDGFGNITSSTTDQIFETIAGSAHVTTSTSDSITTNLDGSSVDSKSVMNYSYNANGTLASAISNGSSTSNDGAGNMSYGLSQNEYAIIANQARIAKSYNCSNSIGTDQQNSLALSQTTYDYTNGKLSAVNSVNDGTWGVTYSYQGELLLGAVFTADEFNAAFAALAARTTNITKSSTVSQTYTLYAGKAKLIQSVTSSNTLNLDGSASTSDATTNYTYVDGKLMGAYGASNGTSDDGFGNITTRVGNDTYLIIAGLAKLLSSTSASSTKNLDGSSAQSTVITNYEYDNGANDQGILTGVTSPDYISTSNDGFGNTTSSTISQVFKVIGNKSRLISSHSVGSSANLDGSVSASDITTSYSYDTNGILLSCTGGGSNSSSDISGNSSTGTIAQSYEIIDGSAKLKTSTAVTVSKSSYELTSSTTTAVTTYEYNSNGKLISASAEETVSDGIDQYGNSYTQTVHRDYVLQYGFLRQSYALTTKNTIGDGWAKTIVDSWYANTGAGSDALLGYSEQGKLLHYCETTKETGTGTQALLNAITTLTWDGIGYTEIGGWLTGYSQVQAVTGTNEKGEGYNLTTNVSRYNIEYYDAGEAYHQGLMKGYEETATSSDAPDKATHQKVTNITYDDFTNKENGKIAVNRTASQDVAVTTTDTQGTLDAITDDTLIAETILEKVISAYNIYGLADLWSETVIDGDKSTESTILCTYDIFGHVLTSSSAINEKSVSDDGATLNKSYTINKFNIEYNILNQAVSWTQAITDSSDAADLVTESTVNAAYDNLGRISTYSEGGTKYDINGSYSEAYTLTKTNFAYDNLGQAVSWTETSTTASAPSKTVTADVTAAYNSDGSILSQSRAITEANVTDSGTTEKKYNLTITYNSYNALGQADNTTTVTVNTDGSSTTIIENNTVYNQFGQKVSYVEEVTETIPGSDTTKYTKTTTVTKFDTLGNVLRKCETTVEGAKTTVRETDADIVYDSLGRMIYEKDQISETGTNNYGQLARYSMTENTFTYDAYGRIATVASLTSTKKSKDATFEESSYTITTNLSFNSDGRADSFKTQDYSAIDLDTNTRTLLSYTITQKRTFNGTGKVTYEEVAYYSNADELVQYETVTNSHFDQYGNTDNITINTYLSSDTTVTPDSSRTINYSYDDLGRALTQEVIYSFNGNLTTREVTTNNQFGLQGGALDSTIKDYIYDNGWVISSLTDKLRVEDALGNVTSETVRVYSDAAKTSFSGGWVTTNTYDNATAAALGNCTNSTTLWYGDETLSQTQLKKSETTNIINASGFISQSTAIVYDGTNIALTKEVKENSSFNADGYAKKSTITSYVYTDGKAAITGIVEQTVSLFDRQGRALSLSSINEIADGTVKSSSVTTNCYYSGGQIQTAKNYLAEKDVNGDYIEWSKEVIKSYAMNALGKPLVTTITTYNPPQYGSGVLSQKTIYSTYDALGNAIKQITYAKEVNDSGVLVDALKIVRESSNFDVFGYAHDTTTITSSYNGTTYDLVNKVNTHTDSYNALGDVVSQTSDTYLLANSNWALAVTTGTENSYNAQGWLTQSIVIKKDSSGTTLKTTTTQNTAFDAFGNANTQTITVNGADGQTTETITRTIETNSLGWEISYIEDTTSILSGLHTHKEYSARAPNGDLYFNALGQVSQYSETTRTYSADGSYDVTTSTTRVISGYDALGQLKSYADTITSVNTQPVLRSLSASSSTTEEELVTTQNYTDIVYDGLGRMASYKITTTSNATTGLTTVQEYSAVTYDALDRMLTYTLVDTQTGTDYNLITTTTRAATTYNSADQATGYTETVTTNADSVVNEIVMSNITYDISGTMANYTQVEHKTAKDSAGVVILDTTDSTTRSGTTCDSHGRVSTYVDTVTHTCADGLLNYTDTVERTSTSYDTKNQVIGYSEKSYSSITANSVYTYTDMSDISYNALGQMLGYTRVDQQHDAATNGTYVNIDPTTVRSAVSYDSFGRLTDYTDVVTYDEGSVNEDVVVSTKMSKITYNAAGLMETYIKTETRTNNADSTLSLNVTDTTTRIATEFYTNGLAKVYTEDLESTATPDLKTTVTLKPWISNDVILYSQYNSNGQLCAYVRDEVKVSKSDNGAELNVYTVTNRDSTAYNSYGQVLAYSEQTLSNAAPDLRTDINSTAMTYDAEGNLLTYTRTERKWGTDSTTGSTLDVTDTITRKTTSYNKLGQVASYADWIIYGTSSDILTINTMSDMVYDNVANITSYTNSEIKKTLLGSVNNITNVTATWSATVATYNPTPQLNNSTALVVSDLTVAIQDLNGEVIRTEAVLLNGVWQDGWSYDSSAQTISKDFNGTYSLNNVVLSIDSLTSGNYVSINFSASATYASQYLYATTEKTGSFYSYYSFGDRSAVTTTARSELVYNDLGQVLSYTDTTSKPTEISSTTLSSTASIYGAVALTGSTISGSQTTTMTSSLVYLWLRSVVVDGTNVTIDERVVGGDSLVGIDPTQNGWLYSADIQGFYKDFSGEVNGEYTIYRIELKNICTRWVDYSGVPRYLPISSVSSTCSASVVVSVGTNAITTTVSTRSSIEYNSKGQATYYKDAINGTGVSDTTQSDVVYREFGVNASGDKLATYDSLGNVFSYYDHTYYTNGADGQSYRSNIVYIDGQIYSFCEGSGIVAWQDFAALDINAKVLIAELVSSGYINSYGVIQSKFTALTSASSLSLSSTFSAYQTAIFNILKNATLADKESYGKDGLRTAYARISTDYKTDGNMGKAVEGGVQQLTTGGTLRDFYTIKNFNYSNSWNEYGQLVYYTEDAGSSRYYMADNDFGITEGYHNYTAVNTILYNALGALTYQYKSETSEGKTVILRTTDFTYQDGKLIANKINANTPTGSYIATIQYDASTGNKISSTVVTRGSNYKIFSTAHTTYLYNSVGKLLSSYSTTQQGELHIESNTTYNSDGSSIVVSHITGTVVPTVINWQGILCDNFDNAYRIIENSTKTVTADGKVTSITGDYMIWNENNKDYHWRRWGTLTMDADGKEKMIQIGEAVSKPRVGWFGKFLFYGLAYPFVFAHLCSALVSAVITGKKSAIEKVYGSYQEEQKKGLHWWTTKGVTVFQIIISIVGAAFGGWLGGIIQGMQIGIQTIQVVLQLAVAVVVAVVSSVIIQLGITGRINGEQLLSAALGAIANFAGSQAGHMDWTKIGTNLSKFSESAKAFFMTAYKFINKIISTMVDCISTVVNWVVNIFKSIYGLVDRLSVRGPNFWAELIKATIQKVIVAIADGISKATKSKVAGWAYQFIATIGVKYAENSAIRDDLNNGLYANFSNTFEAKRVQIAIGQFDDWGSYVLSDLLFSSIDFGIGELIDKSGIASGCELAILGGFRQTVSSILDTSDYYGIYKNRSSGVLGQALSSSAFGQSIDQLKADTDIIAKNVESYLRAYSEDAKSDLNKSFTDVYTEEINLDFSSSFAQAIKVDTAGLEQLVDYNFTNDQTAFRELPFALNREAAPLFKDAIWIMSENGLQMEAQVKVSDLTADWQNQLINHEGLSSKSDVTLVHDMLTGETYVRWFTNNAADLGKDLNAKFDTKHLSNFVEGPVERRVYKLADGRFDSVAIMSVKKEAFANDKQATAILSAAKVDKVKLELHSIGQSFITIDTNIGAAELLNNLGNILPQMRGMFKGVKNLDETIVKSIKFNTSIVNRMPRISTVNRVDYATKVDNLTDHKLASVLSRLGVSSVQLTVIAGGLFQPSRTLVSSMTISGSKYKESDLKALFMEKEKDRNTAALINVVTNVLDSVIDPDKLTINFKEVLNKNNKAVVTAIFNTSISNIKPGSWLDDNLNGIAKLSDGGDITFASTSAQPGQIFKVKVAEGGDASRAQRQDLSPVADKAENTNPAANDKMDAVKTPVTKPTVPGIVSGIGRFFNAIINPVTHGLGWLAQVTGFKHIINAAIFVKGWVFGKVFTVLSGDVINKKTQIKFDSDSKKAATIFIPGMSSNKDGIATAGNKIMRIFDVDAATIINNLGHGIFYLGDVLQTIGYELFGAYDKPVMDSVAAIRQGIADKGEVFVVAHSQGTAIFVRALDLLTPAERAKIHYYGAGSEWFVDANKFGLASARNVYNKGDLVPGIGNLFNPINWAMPGRWYRVGQGITEGGEGNTSWAVIDVDNTKDNNQHSFENCYLGDMKQWASEQIANYKQGVDSATIQTSSNIDNGFNDIASNSLRAGSGSDQQSGIFAYSGEEVSHQSGVGYISFLWQQDSEDRIIETSSISRADKDQTTISGSLWRYDNFRYSTGGVRISDKPSMGESNFRVELSLLLCGSNQIQRSAMDGEDDFTRYGDSRPDTKARYQIRTGDLVQAAASSISYNRDKDSLPMDVKPNINPGEGATLVNPSSPLSPNTIMPKVAGVFFYNGIGELGTGNFYQTLAQGSNLGVSDNKIQSLISTASMLGVVAGQYASDATVQLPAQNVDVKSEEGFFEKAINSTKEFVSGAFDLCKVDVQTQKYYGDKLLQFVGEMGEGWKLSQDIAGMVGIAVRDEGDRVVNKILGYGHYTAKEIAVDKAIALDCSKNEKLDGALIFAVGKGPIQSITRFGEISTIGEHKFDLPALVLFTRITFFYYVGRYVGTILFTNDVVPHHVGQVRSEVVDGKVVNYVMQINPEGETKVTVEEFAKGNTDIKIIMPEKGGSGASEIWNKVSFDVQAGSVAPKMSYDFLRLAGWGSDKNRFDGNKTICSEDVYGKMLAWANDTEMKTGIKIDPLPGVKVDNRVTPWDQYSSREFWDRDKVQEYKMNNPIRTQQIEEEVNRSYKK